MDSFDLAILREISRDRVLWWGSLDPRLSAEEIARRLTVDPSTIRARLRRWEKDGFLRGYEAVPSPRLFGAGLAGGSIRVDDPRAKERVLADLGLVDGVLFTGDHVGPWIAIAMADEGAPSLRRREALIARIPGVSHVEPCLPSGTPDPEITLSALDWRILAALRKDARATLTTTAKSVGVTAKTLAKRYQALVDGRAVWSLPVLDFARWTGAVMARIIVVYADDADPAALGRSMRALFPDAVEMRNPAVAGIAFPERVLDLVVSLDSAGLVEEARVRALGVPGVVDVEIVFPRATRVYGHWFDERIQTALRARP